MNTLIIKVEEVKHQMNLKCSFHYLENYVMHLE